MNLRAKAATIVGVSVAGLMTVTVFASWAMLKRNAIAGEEIQARENVARVRAVLRAEIDNVARKAGDWSTWDDVYRFAQDGNEAFVRSNLQPLAYRTLDFQYFVFTDSRRRVVFGRACYGEDDFLSELPVEVTGLAGRPGFDLSGRESDTVVAGLLNVGGVPTVISARPILTSDGEGPATGTLIVGCAIAGGELAGFQQLTGVGITIVPFAGGVPAAAPESIGIDRPSRNRIVASTLFPDLSGAGAFRIEASTGRSLYRQATDAAKYYHLGIVGICAAFGLLVLGLVGRLVISPVARLSREVLALGARRHGPTAVTVSGNGEISRLARVVAATFASLRESESRFRDVALCSADWVWEVDADGRYTYCSSRVKHVLGYEPEEMVGRTPFALMPADERARVEPAFAALAAARRPLVDLENRSLTKDGREVLLLTNGVPRLDAEGSLLGYRGVDKDITERKRAELALRESEERFRELVQNQGEGIGIVDTNDRFTFANPAAEDIYGVPAGTLVGRSLSEFLDREQSRIVAQHGARRRDGRRETYELVITRPDGERRTLLVTAVPRFDAAGAWAGAFGVFRDITDRKQMLERLRESEERYRDLFENSSDLIQSVGPDGRYLYTNRVWRETLGYSEEEAAGLSFLDVVAPDCREHCLGVFGRIARGEQVECVDAAFITKDGRRVEVEGNLSTQMKDGRMVASRGFFRDVTEQRRAEEVLRAVSERREQLENIVNRSPAVAFLWRVGPGWPVDFVSVNVRQFGYEADEFLSGRMTYADLVHPDDLARAEAESAERVRAGGSEFVQQYRVVTRSGEVRWVEDRTWVPKTVDGRVTHHQGIIVDTTARKRSADELAQKNAELVQLNGVKNQLLGMAAHDLRNPLSVILTASSFMLEDVAAKLTEEKKTDFIRRMKANSEFMLKLIDDLLDVAKIESGRLDLDLADGDITQLVDDNLALNGLLAEKKGIDLRFERPAVLPRLRFDRGKLEQVLNNLVSNALKFSQPGTRVTVSAARQNGSVVVSVRDQGQGIPPDELGRLFLPFSRTSVRSTAGERSTGLGLAIARRIVEGHGGRIWAESDEGRGSVFRFSLPTAT